MQDVHTSGSSFSNRRGSLNRGSFCVGYDSGMETPCGGRVRMGATSQALSEASGMPRLYYVHMHFQRKILKRSITVQSPSCLPLQAYNEIGTALTCSLPVNQPCSSILIDGEINGLSLCMMPPGMITEPHCANA